MGLGKARNQNEIQKQKNDKNPVDFIEAEKPVWDINDIILNSENKRNIDEALFMISNNNKIFDDWGLSDLTPVKNRLHALNFYGHPGTGKSITAEAIAHKLDKNIIKVNYADIESKYVGETPKNIVKIFEKASSLDAVLFFDEADSILGSRLSSVTNSTDTSVNLTRSVMLLQLDKFDGIVIFATNLYKNYDKAFVRRIFSHVHFDIPDHECLSSLWKKYLPSKLPLAPDVVVKELIEKSLGLTGANIKDIILKSTIKTVLNKENHVSRITFLSAINEVCKSISNSEKDYLSDGKTDSIIITEKISSYKLNQQQILPQNQKEYEV